MVQFKKCGPAACLFGVLFGGGGFGYPQLTCSCLFSFLNKMLSTVNSSKTETSLNPKTHWSPGNTSSMPIEHKSGFLKGDGTIAFNVVDLM